jgi:hypothetical protein
MRRPISPRLVLASLSLALALLATSAAGQPRDRAAADALFQAARAEFDRGDFASACEKFAESHRLDPAPGTLLNLALCHEKTGRIASAWEGFRQVADMLHDERVDFARTRSSSLESRLPWLTLHLPNEATDGVRVFRDGIELGSASLGIPLPVDPGTHTLVVEAPGRLRSTRTISMREAQRQDVTLDLGPDQPVSTPAPPRRPKPASESPPSNDHTWTWVAGGIGVAGVATSLATGALAVSSKRTLETHCVDRRCDDQGLDAANAGRTYATISTVSGAVGILGLGVGTYLLLSPRTEQRPSTQIEATAMPGGGFLGMKGRF